MTAGNRYAARISVSEVREWCNDLERKFGCDVRIHLLPTSPTKIAPAGWWEVEVFFPKRGILEPWLYVDRAPFIGQKVKDPVETLFNLVATVCVKIEAHPQAKFWGAELQA